MCNAHNHDPGCGCGFGPPFGTSGDIGDAREWAEDIIDEPPLAREGLEQLGWPERSIEQFLAEYGALLKRDLPEETLVVRINQMLGRYRTVERKVVRERLRVPLFRFSAPKVKGAVVRYNEAYGEHRRKHWWAWIFGLGTGGSQQISFRNEDCYTATNGQCKLVFVPVPIRIAHVDVLDDGEKVGQGIRAQVNLPAKTQGSWRTGRGQVKLKAGDCSCSDPAGEHDDTYTYPLSGDVGPPTIARRTWSVHVEREVFLGLRKVFGAEVRARVGRESSLGVEFELPAGHDYFGGRSSSTIWWAEP